MKFTIILPARLSSSRLPEKALADIAGKPMIVRAAEQAMQTNATKIIVATDHPRIQAACHKHHINTILTNQNHMSGTTRLAEAATLLNLADDEIVVNVQGDEPLIPPELINRVVKKLIDCSTAMATAAHHIHDFSEFIDPNCVKVVLNRSGNALYFSRAPIAYPRDLMLAGKRELPNPLPLRHIGIYAYHVHFLKKYAQLADSPLETCENLEQLRALWHGYDIAVEIIENAPPNGVDTIEDLNRIRSYFN